MKESLPCLSMKPSCSLVPPDRAHAAAEGAAGGESGRPVQQLLWEEPSSLYTLPPLPLVAPNAGACGFPTDPQLGILRARGWVLGFPLNVSACWRRTGRRTLLRTGMKVFWSWRKMNQLSNIIKNSCRAMAPSSKKLHSVFNNWKQHSSGRWLIWAFVMLMAKLTFQGDALCRNWRSDIRCAVKSCQQKQLEW